MMLGASCLSLSLPALEASKGGFKVGRIKDPLYQDSYLGITPPTFIPPFEAPDSSHASSPWTRLGV